MGQVGEKIFQAIPAIMGEIEAVGKNKKNQQQGFMYRGIDDVMNAINPALVKYKVFIVPEVLEQSREERQTNRGGNLIYSICKIKFKFCAEDGSYVEAVTIGEGMDSGDKATNKAMAIAFKYACFQIFCIPTEEMKDPDLESPDVKPTEPPKSPNPKGKQFSQQTVQEEQSNQQMAQDAANTIIDEIKIKVIKDTIHKKGYSESSVLAHYQLNSFSEMNIGQWTNAMQVLEKAPVKK